MIQYLGKLSNKLFAVNNDQLKPSDRAYTFFLGFLARIIVFLRPLIIVRFGRLVSDRIGHFTIDPDVYYRLRKNHGALLGSIDIIECSEEVCNAQLKIMWGRLFKLYKPKKIFTDLKNVCEELSHSKIHTLPLYDSGDYLKELNDAPPFLYFTKEEKEKGLEVLHELNIPRHAKWICIHNRDSAYLKNVLTWDASYHDYRDFSINSMISAAKEFTKRGYYVLRMGAIQRDPLITDDKMIIDYANSRVRSDFADIFLGGNCEFYFGSDSGILCVPQVFRKHICQINYSMTQIDSLIRYSTYTMPFITKHLLLNGTDKLLSLREMFELGLQGATTVTEFKNRGISVIENTPDEILELSIEVADRSKGVWNSSAIDNELQNKFWEIFYRYSPIKFQNGRHPYVGAAFLRRHPHLLN